jgi:branched-chain amino acid transport system permease protein
MSNKKKAPIKLTPLDGLFKGRQGVLLGILALFMVFLIIFPLLPFASGFWLNTITLILLLSAMAIGWNFIGGYTGYAAFGNVAFFGFGAYGTGLSMTKLGLSFFPSLLIGAVAAMLFAILIGLPLLRLKGHYFAIATVAVATAMGEIADSWTSFTGGAAGITLPFFRPIQWSGQFFYYTALILALGGLLLTWIILQQKLGYSWVAIREDEDAANMMGINTTWAKVLAFALSALMAGLAGGIHAYWKTFVLAEEVFKIDYTLQMILAAVLGGTGTIFGPFIGAFLYYILITLLVFYLHVGQLHASILGTIIILVMVFTPKGLMDFISGRKKLTLDTLLENIRTYRV